MELYYKKTQMKKKDGNEKKFQKDLNKKWPNLGLKTPFNCQKSLIFNFFVLSGTIWQLSRKTKQKSLTQNRRVYFRIVLFWDNMPGTTWMTLWGGQARHIKPQQLLICPFARPKFWNPKILPTSKEITFVYKKIVDNAPPLSPVTSSALVSQSTLMDRPIVR